MKRFTALLTLGTLLTVLGVGSSALAEDSCGGKGQKPCPLQGWMEDNVQIPMEKGQYDKVAAALEKVAKHAPTPEWNEGPKSWKGSAEAGVAAAKAGDLKALKKTCKSCHKAHRKEYKKKFRMKPTP